MKWITIGDDILRQRGSAGRGETCTGHDLPLTSISTQLSTPTQPLTCPLSSGKKWAYHTHTMSLDTLP